MSLDSTVPEGLLDWEGAAAYLGTTVRHIKTLTREGKVDHVRIGRKIRFTRAGLDGFITRNTTRAMRA
jgi:excisionase family DNA binding protein